jgi:flagellar motor switch protein FliN
MSTRAVPSTARAVEEALTAAASAAARSLPVASGSVGDAFVCHDVGDLLPRGADHRAVVASISNRGGVNIALIVDADLAARIVDGPIAGHDLVSGVTAALADAVAELEPAFGEQLRCDTAHEVDATVVFDGTASVAIAVRLDHDGVHAGTLAVILDAADSVEPDLDGGSLGFEPLVDTGSPTTAPASIELLQGVEMGVTVELGRTRMVVRDLLALAPGSVIELDRTAGSPVDVRVNGTLIARGEVVVVDEEFGVRISEIISRDRAPGS